MPTLGPADADVWMVYLFDYTCRHCREMHPVLEAAIERYEGRLGLVPMPVPLSAECNPILRRTAPGHEAACDLALLALAVWRADPEQFAAFDHWIYETSPLPTAGQARAKAVELVGERRLQAALESRWPQQHLHASLGVYQGIAELVNRTAVPTFVIASAILAPNPEPEAFFALLEEHSPLEAPAGEGGVEPEL